MGGGQCFKFLNKTFLIELVRHIPEETSDCTAALRGNNKHSRDLRFLLHKKMTTWCEPCHVPLFEWAFWWTSPRIHSDSCSLISYLPRHYVQRGVHIRFRPTQFMSAIIISLFPWLFQFLDGIYYWSVSHLSLAEYHMWFGWRVCLIKLS